MNQSIRAVGLLRGNSSIDRSKNGLQASDLRQLADSVP